MGISLLLVGCMAASPQDSLGAALETPTPPVELANLPRRGQTKCSDDPNLNQGAVNVWELPGVEPPDPNSAYQGDRGEELASLPMCTEIVATDYAWSVTDQEFWVRIRVEDLEGWVPLGLLDFP
jgi:hypothetical protein